MTKHLHEIYKESEIPKLKNFTTYKLFLVGQITSSKDILILSIHVPILRPEFFDFSHLSNYPK